MHQSNGRGSDVQTRSWDRNFVAFMMERDHLVLGLKPWLRISDDDENPRIDNYLGYGELRAIYTCNEQVYSALFRNSFKLPEATGGRSNWRGAGR